MGKFKAGNRVRRIAEPRPWAPIGYETEVLPNGYYLEVNGVITELSDYMWELIPATPEPHPAIRTVTRREIVPGVYGARGEVTVSKAGTSTMVKITIDSPMSKNHLREAAHLFNQIAEVLEDRA